MSNPAERLEYLRGEIEAERIAMSEIAELQGLAEYIDPSDVLLLQWAGVPEFTPTCDICGAPEQGQYDGRHALEADWNGETGNHLSCEEADAALHEQPGDE